MKKHIFMEVFVFLVISIAAYSAGAEGEERKTELTDILKEPLEAILAPVKGGGLVDLVFTPAEMVLMPVNGLEDIATTPMRTPEYVFNVNKSVSVITDEDIKLSNARSIQEILPEEPGIVVNSFFSNPKDNSVDLRGFGEAGPMNYVVLVDGRRMNQIDLSGPDLSQIDISSIQRIEVIRGANSVLYGDNATGGVVNIITKKGEKGDHVEYSQGFGSFRSYKERVEISGGHEFLDYFCSYSHEDTDGYRLNNGYEANNFLSNITVKPADFFDVAFSTSYHRDWYGQPGALYDGNIQSDGRTASRYPDSKAKTEDYFFTVIPRIYGEYGDSEAVLSGFISARSRRANSRNVTFNTFTATSDVYETNHHIGSLEFKPKCEISSLLWNDIIDNKLVFGMDLFRAEDEILSGDITFTKSQLNITKGTYGIYASDNVLIDKRFILSGGVRGEWAKYIFDQFQPAATYGTQSLKEAAFDAGIGYKYNERSQVYANFARSYRYPATDEFFQSAYESFDWWTFTTAVFPAVLNSDLKQQIGNNVEIGVKDHSFSPVKVNAAYFLIDNRKEIYYDPIDFQNENYPHTVHHGFELETFTELYGKVKVFCAYTFEKAFFVGGKFASKTIPLVPENKFFTGLDIKPFDGKPFSGLNLHFSVNYLGSRFIASDQINEVSKLKSHVTLDLGFDWEIENLRFFGGIKNLLGEKYFSNATKNWQGNPAFYPAPERVMEGGVAVRF